MSETPTHWHGLRKAETGVTFEQAAAEIAHKIGLPFTAGDLEQFLVEKMGVKVEEKIDPETGDVVRVPVLPLPPGLEDWFCAIPVDEEPRRI
jgi:hypothetical protein